MAMEAMGFAAPRTEEITEVALGAGGALVTGLAEGVVIKFAPGLGALQPVFTWGTLLGVPLVGTAGALFMKGMIGELFKGVAAGGAAILGYSLPALISPYLSAGGRGTGDRNLLAGGGGVKQLGQGTGDALRRQQAAARAGIEF